MSPTNFREKSFLFRNVKKMRVGGRRGAGRITIRKWRHLTKSKRSERIAACKTAGRTGAGGIDDISNNKRNRNNVFNFYRQIGERANGKTRPAGASSNFKKYGKKWNVNFRDALCMK